MSSFSNKLELLKFTIKYLTIWQSHSSSRSCYNDIDEIEAEWDRDGIFTLAPYKYNVC